MLKFKIMKAFLFCLILLFLSSNQLFDNSSLNIQTCGLQEESNGIMHSFFNDPIVQGRIAKEVEKGSVNIYVNSEFNSNDIQNQFSDEKIEIIYTDLDISPTDSLSAKVNLKLKFELKNCEGILFTFKNYRKYEFRYIGVIFKDEDEWKLKFISRID